MSTSFWKYVFNIISREHWLDRNDPYSVSYQLVYITSYLYCPVSLFSSSSSSPSFTQVLWWWQDQHHEDRGIICLKCDNWSSVIFDNKHWPLVAQVRLRGLKNNTLPNISMLCYYSSNGLVFNSARKPVHSNMPLVYNIFIEWICTSVLHRSLSPSITQHTGINIIE